MNARVWMLVPALAILASCAEAPSEPTRPVAEGKGVAFLAEVRSRSITSQPDEELLTVAQAFCDSSSTSDQISLFELSDWDYGGNHDALVHAIERLYCSETTPTPTSGAYRSSTTTAPPPAAEGSALPPSVDEMKQITAEVNELMAPCTEVETMLTTACTAAAFYSVQALEKLQDRLTSDYPNTRVAVMELISDLEYWSDNCITSEANSPERLACLAYMPRAGEMTSVAIEHYEES